MGNYGTMTRKMTRLGFKSKIKFPKINSFVNVFLTQFSKLCPLVFEENNFEKEFRIMAEIEVLSAHWQGVIFKAYDQKTSKKVA